MKGLKAQSKMEMCSGFKPEAMIEPSLSVDVLDRVEGIDVGDDAFDFLGVVSKFLERGPDGLVDDLQHAAAGEQLVFHQRDVGLDAGGVAIHEEADRAGGGEDGDLGVAIAVLPAELGGAVPDFGGFFFQVTKFFVGGNLVHGATMLFHHLEHGGDVVFRDGLGHAAGARVFVTWERPHPGGHARAFGVGFAGHDGGDGAAKGAAFDAVVTVAVAHDEGAEVGVAEA